MNSSHRWFFILFVVGILEVVYFYPSLPERVATHFALNGAPNGWSSKTTYLFFEFGLQLFMFLLFWGLAKWIPKFPNSAINLPHKEYWLAPERRDKTMRSMQKLMYDIGSVTFGLFVVVNYLVYKSNIQSSPHLGFSFAGIMVVWLILFFFIIIKGMIQFRVPKR